MQIRLMAVSLFFLLFLNHAEQADSVNFELLEDHSASENLHTPFRQRLSPIYLQRMFRPISPLTVPMTLGNAWRGLASNSVLQRRSAPPSPLATMSTTRTTDMPPILPPITVLRRRRVFLVLSRLRSNMAKDISTPLMEEMAGARASIAITLPMSSKPMKMVPGRVGHQME